MNIGMYYLTLFCFSLLIHKIDFDCIKAWTYAFNYMNMFFFRSALANEKETFTIYKTQLGPEHEKTKESGWTTILILSLKSFMHPL